MMNRIILVYRHQLSENNRLSHLSMKSAMAIALLTVSTSAQALQVTQISLDSDLLKQHMAEYSQQAASLRQDIGKNQKQLAAAKNAKELGEKQRDAAQQDVNAAQSATDVADSAVQKKEDEINKERKPLDDALADEQGVRATIGAPSVKLVWHARTQWPEPDSRAISRKVDLVKNRRPQDADNVIKACYPGCSFASKVISGPDGAVTAHADSKPDQARCLSITPLMHCEALEKEQASILSDVVAHTRQVRSTAQPVLDELAEQLAQLQNHAKERHAAFDSAKARLVQLNDQIATNEKLIASLSQVLAEENFQLNKVLWEMANPPQDCGFRSYNFACAGAGITSWNFQGCQTHCQARQRGLCVSFSCSGNQFAPPRCLRCDPY